MRRAAPRICIPFSRRLLAASRLAIITHPPLYSRAALYCVPAPPIVVPSTLFISSRLDSTRRPLSRSIEISARFEAVARPPIPTLVFRIARSPLTPLVYVMIYSVGSPDTSGHSGSFSSHLISASSCSWNRMLKWRLRLLVGSSRRPESLALRSPSSPSLLSSALLLLGTQSALL